MNSIPLLDKNSPLYFSIFFIYILSAFMALFFNSLYVLFLLFLLFQIKTENAFSQFLLFREVLSNNGIES